MMEYPARDSTKLFCALRNSGVPTPNLRSKCERSVVPRGDLDLSACTLGASVTASINAAFVFVVKMSKSRIQHRTPAVR